MPGATTTQPLVNIDGKWVQCLLTEEYECVGRTRFICDVTTTKGQPNRRLLIRAAEPLQAGAAGVRSHGLVIQRAHDESIGQHSPLEKSYEFALPSGNGGFQKVNCKVVQQDITGCISLRRAVLRAAQEKNTSQVLRLFYAACKEMRLFGDTVGASHPVPLQSPTSLAIGPDRYLFLLDAEVRLSNPALTPELRDGLRLWFGPQGVQGYVSHDQASALHARALLLYFRQLLGTVKGAVNAEIPPELQRIYQQFHNVPEPASLDSMMHFLEERTEDWSLSADADQLEESQSDPWEAGREGIVTNEAAMRIARIETPQQTVRATAEPIKSAWVPWPSRKSSLVYVLGLLNIVFAGSLILLMILFLTRGKGSTAATVPPEGGDPAAGTPLSDRTLLYSTYCAVFPTRGTSREKVSLALKELFPDALQDLTETRDGRLLEKKLNELLKSVKSTEGLQELLARLATEKYVRFKGMDPMATDRGLRAIIEQGGIFSSANESGKVEYGSLLQRDGLETLLVRCGINKNSSEREMLEAMKRITLEYASLKDALMMIGARPAYLVHVEPTAEGHAKVRSALLRRQEMPVFVSRPVLEPFDAVDPASDIGSADAQYALQLDSQCYWRLVGKDDREKINFADNPTNARLRWTHIKSMQKIAWSPVGVLKKNGRTDPVSSFDVAVVHGTKVIVFRSQSILVGETRDAIHKQARLYLNALNVKDAVDDAVTIHPKRGKQYTGNLNYSNLADQFSRAELTGSDVQVMELEEFMRNIIASEDAVLMP